MRFISTKIHGFIDYIAGALLIVSPWLFDFANGEAAMWIPIIVGASIILYSLFTNYELGVMRTLNMRTHLVLDGLGGAFLAISPWLFGFADYVWLPHLVVGLLEVGAALMTHTVPQISEPARGSRTTGARTI